MAGTLGKLNDKNFMENFFNEVKTLNENWVCEKFPGPGSGESIALGNQQVPYQKMSLPQIVSNLINSTRLALDALRGISSGSGLTGYNESLKKLRKTLKTNPSLTDVFLCSHSRGGLPFLQLAAEFPNITFNILYSDLTVGLQTTQERERTLKLPDNVKTCCNITPSFTPSIFTSPKVAGMQEIVVPGTHGSPMQRPYSQESANFGFTILCNWIKKGANSEGSNNNALPPNRFNYSLPKEVTTETFWRDKKTYSATYCSKSHFLLPGPSQIAVEKLTKSESSSARTDDIGTLLAQPDVMANINEFMRTEVELAQHYPERKQHPPGIATDIASCRRFQPNPKRRSETNPNALYLAQGVSPTRLAHLLPSSRRSSRRRAPSLPPVKITGSTPPSSSVPERPLNTGPTH